MAPKDAYDFYLSYAKEANGPILEPMCGTGRFLLPLLAEGFNIEGFDASESMLKALATKAKAQNLKPTVWQDFLESAKPSKKYNLIFIPTGSFGLITDLQAIKTSLQIIYHLLDKKGVFIFEVESLHSLPKELGVWRGSRWHTADNKVILLSQLALLEDTICYSIGKYELIDSNQVIQAEIEEYKIRLYNDTSFLLKLLSEVGFKEVKLLKAFSRTAPPEEGDETILFECRK
ncbi:MAG: class I SAM-dependent methyltransferase [Legionella sp.]|nr:MAG: class I SAM-dependent methyltransferase [Legionella sp.]